MNTVNKYINQLKNVFANARDKHEANYKSKQILAEMSGDDQFFTEVLQRHIKNPNSFNTAHYPVVSLPIDSNPYFTLVANCWIPLPDRSTQVSTKAIHHHGDMLLTTATAFGTGYEHWTFETPQVVDAGQEIYSLKVLEQAAHPLHHVSFVDAYIAHLPLYPPDLTITYALWSSRFPTTWKDYVKRMQMFQDNSQRLRTLIAKFGLAKQMELKIVDYFDFYPSPDGFKGIKDREEFERGPNEDYLESLFHIIQETGNDHLAINIQDKLNSSDKIDNRAAVEKLLNNLKKGEKIDGRLSSTHYNVPKANFTKEDIINALGLQTS